MIAPGASPPHFSESMPLTRTNAFPPPPRVRLPSPRHSSAVPAPSTFAGLPGMIDTQLLQDKLDPTPLTVQEHAEKVPMHRVGEAHEIATVVAFLLGSDASYITVRSFTKLCISLPLTDKLTLVGCCHPRRRRVVGLIAGRPRRGWSERQGASDWNWFLPGSSRPAFNRSSVPLHGAGPEAVLRGLGSTVAATPRCMAWRAPVETARAESYYFELILTSPQTRLALPPANRRPIEPTPAIVAPESDGPRSALRPSLYRHRSSSSSRTLEHLHTLSLLTSAPTFPDHLQELSRPVAPAPAPDGRSALRNMRCQDRGQP